MEKIRIKRIIESPKSEVITLRTTPQEKETLQRMEADLNFTSMRDLLLFCLTVTNELHKLHTEGYALLARKDGVNSPIDIEFQPQKK